MKKFNPKIFLLTATCILSLISSMAFSATYYVATNGSDSSGSGGTNAPWGSINHGISKLSSGDTLIVRDGLYTGSSNFINGVPNGSPGKFTTIKAENPMEVRIENDKGLSYYQYMVHAKGSYIHIDGFVVHGKNSQYPSFLVSIEGDHNKVSRCIIKREGALDAYGGWLSVYGSYNLVEDCAGSGHARYGFYTGGPSSTDHHNIFRRIVARIDYVSNTQPKAAIGIYGNNADSNGQLSNVHHVLIQNAIILDGQSQPTAQNDQGMYGGIYFPKNLRDVTIQGSIVLNNSAKYAGYFIGEFKMTQNITLENSVAWGIKSDTSWGAAGVRANTMSYGCCMTWNALTIGDSKVAYYNSINSTDRIEFTNSIATGYDTLKQGDGGFSKYDNVKTGVELEYIVDSGSNAGARINKRYGKSGTLWGEEGFDQVTEEDIWPYPYENKIKEVFAEDNPPASNALPTTNDTKRGFAAPGNDKFGEPLTLTRYIWQYLGNQIPAGIYSNPPLPPVILDIKVQ